MFYKNVISTLQGMYILCSKAWGVSRILSFVRLAGLLGRPGLDATQGPGWPGALSGLAGLLPPYLLPRLPSWAWLATCLALFGLPAGWPRWPGQPRPTKCGPYIKRGCARVCAGMRQVTMSLDTWPGWLAFLISSPPI